MYLTYFKREFAKKHENSGVLASFVLFLSGIKDGLEAGLAQISIGYKSNGVFLGEDKAHKQLNT